MTPKRIIIAIVSTIAAVIVLALVFGGKPEVTPGVLPAAETTSSSSSSTTAAPKLTEGQENALGKVNDYLVLGGFSQKWLQGQLVTFDKFSPADAKFAVTHAKVNWNEQAVKKAQDYLAMTHFSRAGLKNQLIQFDKFTEAQADQAVTKAFSAAE
jgi:Host cell surface-exposed lipoprotein